MKVQEQTIVLAMRANTERGFRLLVETYQEEVYWHIRRLVVDYEDARDVAQETFVRTFRAWSKREEGQSLRAWLFRIATNEALRLLGRQKGRETLSLDEAIGCAALEESSAFCENGDVIALRLQKAMLALPAKQQVTFNLRYYDELSFKEIAQVMDTTEANAKANYHVAKQKIVEFMQAYN